MAQQADESFDLEALCRGDEAPWKSFYRTYAPLIKRILSWPKWRFSHEEQEDMLQEVFIQLMKSMKNYKGEAKVSTFVARIAQNACVSSIRKKLAHKRGDGQGKISLDELDYLGIANDPLPLQQVIESEQRQHLHNALEQLGVDCQALLKLRYVDDWSYYALSEKYREPISTLASRLKRCLLQLRGFFEEKLPGNAT